MADNTALLAEAAAISQQTLNDELKKEKCDSNVCLK
jgi:hypothetical protein